MATKAIKVINNHLFRESAVEKIGELLEKLMKETFMIPIRAESTPVEGWYIPSVSRVVQKKDKYNCYDGAAQKITVEAFGYKVKLLTVDDAKQFISNVTEKVFITAIERSTSFNSIAAPIGHYIACSSSKSLRFEDGTKLVPWADKDSVYVPFGDMPKGEFVDGIVLKSIALTAKGDLENQIQRLLGNDEEESSAKPCAIVGEDELQPCKDALLKTDTNRFNAEKYDENLLTDPNRGHWDLWSQTEPDNMDGRTCVVLPENITWYARNPIEDVKDGLVGIDFGTKSTIVSYQDDDDQIKFHRIGSGEFKKQAGASDYENPTFMEFLDYTRFEADYGSRAGRPETHYEDLAISHKAVSEFTNGKENNKFYSFFYDIKQWCSESRRSVRLKDQNNRDLELKPFAECEQGDFNPLELYAYYLGLYINNMRNGIYLDYRLSFPVSFPMDIREKMLTSFKNGLKKSFPPEILSDEECMENFQVDHGVSEPVAYAVTALKQYGFRPNGAEDRICYAVFDFGGGTADFDFGICRAPDPNSKKERGKEFIVEHFNQASDSHLGGENLLELLAFRIFKANIAKMREKDLPFQRPYGEMDFPGAEGLVDNSREARRNMKNLAELLRPLWEGIRGKWTEEDENRQNEKKPETISTAAENPEGEEAGQTESADTEQSESQEPDKVDVGFGEWKVRIPSNLKSIAEEGLIKVTLYNKSGESVSETLYVSNGEIELDLIGILKARIQDGTRQFFEAFVRAKQKNADIYRNPDDRYVIFLAGNSSRSPLLLECLEEEKERLLNKAKDAAGSADDAHAQFEFYPPLGTPEADQFREEHDLPTGVQNEWSPTGKTGVAYGLILGRDGGKIRVVEIEEKHETKFRYHLGSEQNDRFCVHSKLVRDMIELGKWVNFTEDKCGQTTFIMANPGDKAFEIWYSDLPSAATDRNLGIGTPGIHKKKCKIKKPDEDAYIWLRCVNSDTIEYCLSKNEDGQPSDAEAAEKVSVTLGKAN